MYLNILIKNTLLQGSSYIELQCHFETFFMRSWHEIIFLIYEKTSLGFYPLFPKYTEQDAREAMRVVFSVLTKRICMHKTNFLRTYSNIVLKVILNCMNMQIATQLIMMYNL